VLSSRTDVDAHNIIGAGERIDNDPKADRKLFHVTESGVTVIPAGKVNYFTRDSGKEADSGYAE